ncbi:DUF2157 domain-containing protein [Nocardia sp. NPDC005978]|uniref:DUF2157 domain-containing protein n=1 Tax=Nocardia sp. NPDC005978 TaxID=3156725 RepID=UPI0033B8DCCE
MAGDRSVGVALARLVERGVLTAGQRDAVVAEIDRVRDSRGAGVRWGAEVAAYAGAGLVLGGVVLLLDSAWEDLGRVAQLGVMAVVIAGLIAGGYLVAGGRAGLFRGFDTGRTVRRGLDSGPGRSESAPAGIGGATAAPGGPREESGGSREESGGSREESGGSREESGGPRGESGGPREESGDLREESGDLRGESGGPRGESDGVRGESGDLRGDPDGPRGESGGARRESGGAPVALEPTSGGGGASSPGPGTSRVRLGAALFALAAGCVAVFVGIAVNGEAGDVWVWPVVAGLVAAVVGYAALPSVVGLLVCAGFAPAAWAGVLDAAGGSHDVVFGAGLLVLAGIWFGVAYFGFAVPAWAGYAAGIVTGLIGAQTAGDAGRPWAYGLTGLVAVACFALYRVRRSAVLVLGGALALAIGVSTAVWDWTGGTAAAFVIVLLVGAVVLGAGVALLVRERGDTGTPG